MMTDKVNIVIAQKKPIKISTGSTSEVVSVSSPVTLKNIPTLKPKTTIPSLDELPDVDASNETDGATLVYNKDTKKFVVQEITITVESLDGGLF